jgi:hypothetical protein
MRPSPRETACIRARVSAARNDLITRKGPLKMKGAFVKYMTPRPSG